MGAPVKEIRDRQFSSTQTRDSGTAEGSNEDCLSDGTGEYFSDFGHGGQARSRADEISIERF